MSEGLLQPIWSATRLKSFLTCPRQFKYSYVDGIPSIPTSPLVFGRVLHETLCFSHEWQMANGTFPPIIEVLLHFDTAWKGALEEEQPFFRPNALTPQAHQRLAHELLRAFLASPHNANPPLTVELAFEVEAQGHKLCGVIDRVDEGENGLIIVDFKSGARKPQAAELETELQFTLYSFAAQKVLGQPVERVVHYHLRDGSLLETRRGEDDFAWMLDTLIPFVAQAVEREEFAPRYGYHCNFCDYRELCAAQNRARAVASLAVESLSDDNRQEVEV